MPLNRNHRRGLVVCFGGGGGALDEDPVVPDPLSDDTSLSTFTVEGQAATDEGTLDFSYAQGVDKLLSQMTVVATPTHVGATVGAMSLTPDPMVVGDNLLEFDVTAEDGVTVQHYNVTLHVLTAGVAEVTTLDFTILPGDALTGGKYLLYPATPSDRKCLWFCFEGVETQPDASGQSATSYQRVDVGAADIDGAAVATKVAAATGGSAVGAVVTLTAAPAGVCTDAADFNTTAVVTTTTQGVDPA